MPATGETAKSTALVVGLKPKQIASSYMQKWLPYVADHGTKEKPIGFVEGLVACGCLDWTAWPITADLLRVALHPGTAPKPGEKGPDGKVRGKRAGITPGEHAELTEQKKWAIDGPLMMWAKQFGISKIGTVDLSDEQPEIGIIEVAVARVQNDLEALTEDEREHFTTLLRDGARIEGVREGRTQALTMWIEPTMASARKANEKNWRVRAEMEYEAKTREVQREAEQRIVEKERAVDALRMKLLEDQAERDRKNHDRLMTILENQGRPMKIEVGDQPHGNA